MKSKTITFVHVYIAVCVTVVSSLDNHYHTLESSGKWDCQQSVTVYVCVCVYQDMIRNGASFNFRAPSSDEL